MTTGTEVPDQQPEGFIKLIEQSSLVTSEEVLPHRPLPYDLEQIPNLDSKLTRGEGVVQELKGVVRAGDEKFSVVEATVNGRNATGQIYSDKALVVARFPRAENERAEIVRVLFAGQSMVVGRTMLDENDFKDIDPELSRKHFAIGFSTNNEVVITDQESTNGTKFVSRRHGKDGEGEIKIEKGMYKEWMPDSGDVKEAIRVPQKQRTAVAGKLVVELAKNDDDTVGAVVETSEVGTMTRAEKLDALEEGLTQEDRDNLFRYSRFVREKRLAHENRDDGGAKVSTENIGNVYKELSPAAKAVSHEHARIFDS